MFLLLFVLLLLYVLPALAQGGFAIEWWTVDGGGGRSSGGVYLLEGTAGQPDVNVHSGGAYRLEEGFWADKLGPPSLYLPQVAR